MKAIKLFEGLDGSGIKIFIIATLKDDIQIWSERFYSENEAQNWINHAC